MKTSEAKSRGVIGLFGASILSLAAAAFGQPGNRAIEYPQGEIYRRVPDVPRDEAQVVFFRRADQSGASRDAAHVYVDGELEGALMPNGYTRFCVRPGVHSVEAYIGDAPLYAGKAYPKTDIELEGGGTYFVGVSENGSGEPVLYPRADAERLLETSREEINIINRASAVGRCSDRPERVGGPAIQFTLRAEVLFPFDRGDAASITAAGRGELEKIASQVLALPPESFARVTVVGHADPIGADAYNRKLSEARARTVADVLSQYGIARGLIHTVGVGSAEPVVECPSAGRRAERIRCNAPNRRVEVNAVNEARSR